MKRLALLVFFTYCTGSGCSLFGAGLDYLSSHSSAVIIGSVSAGVERPTQVEFTLTAERVLAGSLPAQTVHVLHNNWASLIRGAAQTPLSSNLYGIWFLVQSGETWDVIPARPSGGLTIHSLYLPASRTPLIAPFAYPTGTPAIDALTYELAAGVQSANEDPLILLDAFNSMDTPVIRSVLLTFQSAAAPDFEAISLSASIERNIPGAIQMLAQLWPVVSTSQQVSYVLSALKNGWRDSTPANIVKLSALAASTGDKNLRLAAVWALAAIHSKETLPFLGGLLSNGSPEEQERALYGVSAFANGCPIQSKSNVISMAYLQCGQSTQYKDAETIAHFAFRPGPADQETLLVSFWQTWWNNHTELH